LSTSRAGGYSGEGVTPWPPNYYDVDTSEDYWISGPKRNGGDRWYGGNSPIEIDEDVREEYWQKIRRQPTRVDEKLA
jgi:hypothetical protein